MESPALHIAVLWPLSIVITAVVCMAIWRAFSWTELIFDAIAGVVIGAITVAAFAEGAGPGVRWLLIPSHGLIGLLQFTGAIEIATLSGFFLVSALSVFGAAVLSAALDHAAVKLGPRSAGGTVIGILMLPLKLTFAPLTTAVGLLMFLAGAIRSFWPNGRIGIAGGELFVEWSQGGTASAVTLGGTVHIWTGSFADLIDHELCHSRQYIYLRDWMIPFWLLGGIWGLISSAVADKRTSLHCFAAARPGHKGIGNPLETGPYNISGGSYC
jgi:hypothetical protein